MNDIRKLEPKQLWNCFHEITQIPHPSKKEKRFAEYVKDFGNKLRLETIMDPTGNVLIRKPATKGMENRTGVVLQAHLDMVPQKNNDKKHDFEKDPIETIVDGEWVKANGTTLGADDGIGVAAVMAILMSENIPHGPIEALFTIDEETGMTGVNGFEKGVLKGDILLNLDSEEEGEIYVGCAGGVDVNITRDYTEEKVSKGMVAYKITAKGLKGGHSGVDIALGRANANKIMFRFLMQAESDFKIRLAEAAGGDLRNAIPRESHSIILVADEKAKDFEKFVENYGQIIKLEFAETEPDMAFFSEKVTTPAKVMGKDEQYKIIRAVFACPNGVQRMSQSMKGMVETSNNLAIVRCAGGKFEAYNLTRSSVDSSKEAVAWKIAAVFQLIGSNVTLTDGYPGWKPDMQSPVLKTMSKTYKDLFNSSPEIKAIHAGLECAILGGTYPNLDMISFGPTIKHPHSPDERVNIQSVARFWDFLVGTLRNIPVKK